MIESDSGLAYNLNRQKSEDELEDEKILERIKACVDAGAMSHAHVLVTLIVSEEIQKKAKDLFNPYKR